MIYHGDNLDIMQTLPPASVHLAYLDPPFNTGRDFAHKPRDGSPEEPAYSDKWPSLDAYIETLTLRLVAARPLLTDDGSIFVHVDPTFSHDVRRALDGVFGRRSFVNEIVWRYRRWPVRGPHFQRMHDVILWYARGTEHRWSQPYEPLADSTIKTWGDRKQRAHVVDGKRRRSTSTDQTTDGAPMGDVWTDIGVLAPIANERTGYPTQKPVRLLERIIAAASRTGDTVLDPYFGSGTTGQAVQNLGRKWVGLDSSPVAIRVSSERLGVTP